jgi:hypothetical protein
VNGLLWSVVIVHLFCGVIWTRRGVLNAAMKAYWLLSAVAAVFLLTK